MAWTATFSNPQNNYAGSGGLSAAVDVASIAIEADFGAVSSCTLYIRHDVASIYGLETADTTNPCQLNSTVTVTGPDSNSWFKGFVISDPQIISFDDGRYLVVECHGKEGVLLHTLCPYTDGARRWTEESDTYASTGVALEASDAYGDFAGDTLWPEPVAHAALYLSDAASNSDTLDANIGTGALDVVLSTTDAGFLPRGWLKIDSEWMYYDGYDDTASGGKFRCKVTARGQLGTTETSHTAGATVYNKVAKQIAPGQVNLYKDGTRLRYDKEYAVLWREGGFLLQATASGTYTADYSVYDEDSVLDAGSVPVTLEDVVKLLVKAPALYGGAGFADGNLNFDTLNLKLNRYDYDPEDKPVDALSAIEQLIETIGLENEVRFWYDHTADKLRLAIIANAGSPDLTLDYVTRIEKESDIEDVYSGVLVQYTDDQPINRVNSTWSNHVGCAATGAKPDTWYRVTADGENWEDGSNTTDTSASDSSFGMDMLHDGKADTKLRAEFDHDPGGSFTFGDVWFGDGTTPPTIQLDAIDIRVNNYRAIEGWSRTTVNAENTYRVRVQGCNDYDSSAKDSAGGTWRDLFELEGKPEAEGIPELHTVSDFPLVNVNALRVIFDYMAGPKQSGDFYWAAVHNLNVRGKQTKYVFVQTTDDDTLQDPAFLYAPGSHTKLRGGVLAASAAGAPRCAKIEIGPSSEGAAYSVGRAWLRNKLRLFHMRHYEYKGAIDAKPELGDTIAIDENGDTVADYTGVCYGYSIAAVHDDTSIELRVLDAGADAIE